jgi:hypothetical protein
MIRHLTTALISAAMLVSYAAATQAEEPNLCLPHDAATAELAKGYQEQSVGLGLGNTGEAVYELFVAESGTWTILITQPDGISCIAAHGDNWSARPLLVGDPA